MSDYNEFGYTILNTGNVRFMKLFHSWRQLLNYVYELQELTAAIADFSKSANLFLKQGKTKDYQNSLNMIKQLQ